MPPNANGILESSLYVSDVARSVRFYQETQRLSESTHVYVA